jgi:hypothetical protein
MKALNQDWQDLSTKSNDTDAESDKEWPIRRDDTFPYSYSSDIYLNGFYSSRPNLKKNIAQYSKTWHSTLRLAS